MRVISHFLCFILLIVFPVLRSSASDDVITLTTDNFVDLTTKLKDEVWYIRIVAEFCQASKNMEPAWKDVAWKLKEDKIKVGEVNVAESPEIGSAFKAYAYPFIFILRKGKFYKYTSHLKTSEALQEFAKIGFKKIKGEKMNKISQRIDIKEEEEVESKYVEKNLFVKKSASIEVNEDNFKRKTKKGLWFIFFFANWSPHSQKAAPVWIKLANRLKDEKSSVRMAHFECTDETQVPVSYKVRVYPTIIYLYDGEFEHYDGESNDEKLNKWIEQTRIIVNKKKTSQNNKKTNSKVPEHEQSEKEDQNEKKHTKNNIKSESNENSENKIEESKDEL